MSLSAKKCTRAAAQKSQICLCSTWIAPSPREDVTVSEENHHVRKHEINAVFVRCARVTSFRDRRFLLANAKTAENAVQQIVGVYRAYHFSKLVQGRSQFQCENLRRFAKEHGMVRSAEALLASIHVMPAPAQTGSKSGT